MKSSPRCHGATTAAPTISAKAARTTRRAKPPTASLKSPVPERRRCRTSDTAGARRMHRLSPRRPIREVPSRRDALSSGGRTPKLRPRYHPRSPTYSAASHSPRPQSWRQKRCPSARIIVHQVNNLEAGPYYARRNLLDTTELALQVESCSPRRLRRARPLGRVGRLRAFGRGLGRRAKLRHP